MCIDCHDDKALLPSLETFDRRLELPKINYLFYEYFFKAAVSEKKWKANIDADNPVGLCVLEAYTHATLQNNYFSWLFDFHVSHNKQLLTEYEPGNYSTTRPEDDPQAEDEPEGDVPDVFTGDLKEVEVTVMTGPRSSFKICSPDLHPREYELAAESAKRVLDETRDKAQGSDGRKGDYEKMKQELWAFQQDNSRSSEREWKNKKRRILKQLKPFTNNSNREEGGAPTARQGSNRKKGAFKGWSPSGKRFMDMMTEKIKSEEDAGKRMKFQREVYQEAQRLIQSRDRDGGQGESEEVYERNYNVLYAEV